MVMCFAIWFILKLEIKMNKKFEYQWSIVLHLSKCWTKNVTRNYLRCERKNFHLQMARDIRRKQNRLYTIVYLKRYKLKMIKVNLSSFTIYPVDLWFLITSFSFTYVPRADIKLSTIGHEHPPHRGAYASAWHRGQ